MSKRAFALKASVDPETYLGGSVEHGGGEFQIPAEKLAKGEAFVVDDYAVANLLADREELKEVPVSEARPAKRETKKGDE